MYLCPLKIFPFLSWYCNSFL